MSLQDLVFVGFNSRVATLDRHTGQIVWQWKAHTGRGYVTTLLDGEQLFVAVSGYQYCLNASNGSEIWFNRMEGFGFGVTSISTARGSSESALQQAAAASAQAAAASSGASTTT